MKDKDIEKLRKMLVSKGRTDIADLLMNSRSILNKSSTYGHILNSVLSTFDIYSPISKNIKLLALHDEDKGIISESVWLIYPRKDNMPEVYGVEFYPDFDLEDVDLIKSNSLESISFDYIKEQISKCDNKIQEKDFEGAITNARTLVESICLFIIESTSDKECSNDGNLIKLYKKVSNILNLNPSNQTDENLKQILSGLISLINGISGLRNNHSDAHGGSPSQKKYKIDQRHAVLAVNSAKTISEYLYKTYEKLINKK